MIYSSGECEVDLARRELRVHGSLMPIGGRAFELLEVLVRSAGELVTKDALMQSLWPGAVVMEGTLHVHAASVRRALGPYRELLKTESRRGYRLLGEWRVRRADAKHPPNALERAQGARDSTNVPVNGASLVGRSVAVNRLQDLVSAYRVVTLTGPGGIGKSALAIEIVRRMHGQFADGGWLVELASLTDPALVPSAVAGVLRLELGSSHSVPEVVARAIGDMKLLLLLDNCEHLIGAVARLADALLASCPQATIIATSRETLRIQGEYVFRVPPLETPASDKMDVTEVLGYSAPELFVSRASELGTDFSSDAHHVTTIASICRQLDGIPLAIEFAATRAATIGLDQVATGLRDRFALLTRGRRTALPRHRTLRATLDWSYALLPDAERGLLRRLAIFQGGFTVEAAIAVASDGGDVGIDVLGSISNLVEKSLVTIDGFTGGSRWRLLETIRAYALEELNRSGEREQINRYHAEYYRNLFVRAELQALTQPASEWLAAYACEIDNLRLALDWAFSHGPDMSIGIELSAAAVPLWVYLSDIEERRRWVERALASLATSAASGPRLEMKLLAALGASQTWIGEAASETEAIWAKTYDLAESLGSEDYRLRALWGLWLAGDRTAAATAQRFSEAASSAADRLMADQMMGFSLHWQGDQRQARTHLERVIAHKDAAANRINRFHVDQQPSGILARVLWLQGFPAQAMAMAEQLVHQATVEGHASSLCHALGMAGCPIALWIGDFDLAGRYVDLLQATLSRYGLAPWNPVCRAHRGVLLVKQGDHQAGLRELRGGFEACLAMPAGYRFTFIAEMAEALCPEHVPDGLRTIEKSIERAELTEEGWILAELLRIKGEQLRLIGANEAAAGCFLEALHLARTQGALSWELRAATSLAMLGRAESRGNHASARLRSVYDRFTEGLETPHLREAKWLLAELLSLQP